MPENSEEEAALRRLAAANPAPFATVAGSELSAKAREGARRILDRPRRPRWWRRKVTVIPLIISLAGASVAATYELTRPVTNTIVVGCFSAPTLHSMERATALAGNALETCASLWQSGELDSHHGTPPLVECVEPSGTAVVFPTRNVAICSVVGLASPGAADVPEGQARAAQQLTKHLGAIVLTTSCLAAAVALSDARQGIAEEGLNGWQVIDGGRFSSGQPCAGFYVDSQNRQVELIPQARHP